MAATLSRSWLYSSSVTWQLWIDRGGTFTDAIGYRADAGEVRTAKVLSGPGSVMTAVRAVLGLGDGEAPPPLELRLGTTLATNALLERRWRADGAGDQRRLRRSARDR
jgi:5-oxoprolinase (ATP-hydrolysing)